MRLRRRARGWPVISWEGNKSPRELPNLANMHTGNHMAPRKLIWLLFVAVTVVTAACKREKIPDDVDFRQEMRLFVQGLSGWARLQDPDFIVIPQNGQDLVYGQPISSNIAAADYLAAIDGIGREDLWYGYEKDDQATPGADNAAIRAPLDLARDSGVTILVTDYCSTPSKMDDAYTQNAANGYVGFAAPERELNVIPSYPATLTGLNADTIRSLAEVRNFLYLINPDQFASKQAFIQAVTATNYDLVLMDLFWTDDSPFSAAEVQQLRAKANGGQRLLVSYMSIGEAEDYRYYWDKDWKLGNPDWLGKENSNWKGNYKVHFWESGWQDIIYGNGSSYLQKILDAGFDGAYLDIIDAFEYYESKL
jgi:cysteinyl-tRNA synthetase, unknown class